MKKIDRVVLLGLLLATVLAAALRFALLNEVPAAVYCDEAFSAYEAFSLLETGKDTRGVAWPLFFDIFGEGWAEPLYIYLTLPAVALFGLTPMAARFAAAAAGTLAVPITGLMTAALVRMSTTAEESSDRGRLAGWSAVSAAFLMALSPWSFHFSRIGFQASLLPLTLAAGFWVAAQATGGVRDRVRPGLLVAAAALLASTLYTYTISRLAMPLFLVGFLWLNREKLMAAWRATLVAGSVLVLLSLPVFGFTLTEEGRQRFGNVSIFGREDVKEASLDKAALEVGKNYLSYVSPGFLLTEGDPHPRHSVRDHGVLHPHDAVFLVLGVLACAMTRSRGPGFLLWWLVAFPVAASLTIDPRHAIRAICGQPVIYAVAGIGVSFALVMGKTTAGRFGRLVPGIALILVGVGATVSTVRYFRHYFTEYPVYSAPAWQYGMKEAYKYLENVPAEHENIYVQEKITDQPHSLLLFYLAFPPQEYQEHRLARTRYVFNYPGDLVETRKPVFLVGAQVIFGDHLEIRKVIKHPDGSDAYKIIW